jgi:hypothetical protein
MRLGSPRDDMARSFKTNRNLFCVLYASGSRSGYRAATIIIENTARFLVTLSGPSACTAEACLAGA